jgi:hypothetical protein
MIRRGSPERRSVAIELSRAGFVVSSNPAGNQKQSTGSGRTGHRDDFSVAWALFSSEAANR